MIQVKALLINLDRGSTEVVTHHLELNGYDTVGPVNPSEAWQQLVMESPGAVIVEVSSVSDQSWQLVERIRDDGRFQSLPTVVVSSSLDPNLMDKATALGCQMLGKPFSVSALLDKVNLAIRRSGPPRTGHVDLTPVRVEILLDVYLIEGEIHLPPEVDRFSDAWESLMKDDRTFLPVTDARIATLAGEEVVASAKMVQVRKEQIRAINTQGEPYNRAALRD